MCRPMWMIAAGWFLTVAVAHPCDTRVDVRSHGAVGDGVTDDTTAIQASIDAAAAESREVDGQVCAELDMGVFLSGQLHLKSGVILFVGTTAILKASTNGSLYHGDTDWPYNVAFICGYSVGWSGVAGSGVIDGQAPQYVTSLNPVADQYDFEQLVGPFVNGPFRYRLVDFKHSRNVRVQGVTLLDSPSFHLHFLNSSDILVESVTVSSDLRWPNCDGIDVTSCNNTIIRGCTIRTGDDAISPKTWQGYGPLHNLLIEDCTFHARSGGIHFGASAWYDYVNVTVRNVRVLDSHGGLSVQVRGPGSVKGLRVENFMVGRTTWNSPCYPWMGNGNPVVVSADVWASGPAGSQCNATGGGIPCGTISDVSFENVTSQSENGIMISGGKIRGAVQNITFTRVVVVIQQLPSNNGSFGPCPSRNYWPTSRRTGSPEGGEIAPINGIFIEYAAEVTVADTVVSFAGQPKNNNTFGGCFAVDSNSTSSVVIDSATTRCNSAVTAT